MLPHAVTRRRCLQLLAGAAALAASPGRSAAETGGSRLGLVTYCCRLRRDHRKRIDPTFDLFDPLNFLEHCRQLGAGGMQINLGKLDADAAGELRHRADQTGLFIEAIVTAPFEKKDLDKFESAMRTAADVGALAARTTIIPGRRYEFFDSLTKFREYAKRGRIALENAAPIAERHKVPLAVENHKDQRNDERVALFRQISSEYVGACVDTGNSVALLEDPIETVRALAPWAHSVHLKDQSLRSYEDGFLLGDIPLGQGSFDLRQMVDLLRAEKPEVKFNLELITRDPLMVPTMTDKYWATFPDVSGRELAHTMQFVRDRTRDNLQYISKLTPDEQLAREDANVKESLDYAAAVLDL